MKTVVVTGHGGFIGRNLVNRLRQRDDLEVIGIGRASSKSDSEHALARADAVVHLAGVNRPEDDADFEVGNVGLTAEVCEMLSHREDPTLVIYASSKQAALDNPYGRSKRRAEEVLTEHARLSDARIVIFRLANVFGKWCRPNYNSVVATFCHNLARGLPIRIDEVGHEVELVYVDDVVDAFVGTIDASPTEPGVRFADALPATTITVGELARRIEAFHQYGPAKPLPDLSEPFDKQLYATFLSHRDPEALTGALEHRRDDRGALAEFVRGPAIGQVFVSRTRPGVTRGNHFHRTKTEKFLVLEGRAVIQMRTTDEEAVREITVSGETWTVVDIPPGVTHNITNVGEDDLVTLFWASEPFDAERPDTWYEPV